jgi:hypothetical protein
MNDTPSSKHTTKDPILGFWRKRHNTPLEKQIKAPAPPAAAKAEASEGPLNNPFGARGSWSAAVMNTMSFGSRGSVVSDAGSTADGANPNLERRASQPDGAFEDDICIYGF